MLDNWEELEKSIQECNKCNLCNNKLKAFGEKNTNIMGISFKTIPDVGPCKEKFTQLIGALDLEKENMYVTSIIKCITNEKIEEKNVQACLDYLRNEVVLIKPKVIVLLGYNVAKGIFGDEKARTIDVNKVIEMKGIKYIPTYSIEETLEKDNIKMEVFEAFKIAKELLDEKI